MTNDYTLKTKLGIGLVEVIIGVAILVFIIVGVVSAYRVMIYSSGEAIRSTQAQALLEEGLEVARIFRDTASSSILNLSVGTDYTLVWNGTAWATSTTPSLIDGIFDRRMSVEQVYRDADNDIAGAGTLDPDTRKVTVTVSWNRGETTLTRTLSTYIGNIFD